MYALNHPKGWGRRMYALNHPKGWGKSFIKKTIDEELCGEVLEYLIGR